MRFATRQGRSSPPREVRCPLLDEVGRPAPARSPNLPVPPGDHLGGRIDVILKENYGSVLAAERMKEALERMDSAALFAIGGRGRAGAEQFAEYRPVFEKNLKIEQNNVTLPGEQEMPTT